MAHRLLHDVAHVRAAGPSAAGLTSMQHSLLIHWCWVQGVEHVQVPPQLDSDQSQCFQMRMLSDKEGVCCRK